MRLHIEYLIGQQITGRLELIYWTTELDEIMQRCTDHNITLCKYA